MADFSDIDKKLARLPWKGILITLGISFLCASVISAVAAQLLFPKDKSKGSSRSAAGKAQFNVPSSQASLSPKAVDIILKRNIFNSEGIGEGEGADGEGDAGETDEPSEKVVKSDLAVKLMGTIYGGDPYSGAAIIENTSKRTINTFMVGDVLLKGARIKEVLKEKVIIENNGRLEYIDVEKTKLVRSRRSKRGKKPTRKKGPAPIATEPPPSTYKEDGFERKGAQIAMDETYRQKLLTTDFTKVLQDAKASPNMVDGELKGFKLTRIRKDSIYEKAGFQNMDVVEEVNGVPLTDTGQAIRLLQSLRNEKEIDVRITRGGTPMTFTLSIK